MRNDTCVLILTHGRPDRVFTLRGLETHGWTGPTFLVIDDEDATGDEYRRLHGDKVITFSKQEAWEITDDFDNFGRRGVVYARNAAWDVARRLGFRYFIVLDDDYSGFYYRFDAAGRYGAFKLEPLDHFFAQMVEYLAATPFVTLAISQGGDHIGGGEGKKAIEAKRKAMNVFVCDTERRFKFGGRINEDVNAYVMEQRRGLPFLTIMGAQVNQRATQTNPGGLTELYLDVGTYVKSFYSVMCAPSCVKVSVLSDPRVGGVGYKRLHHLIDWEACAPLIVREEHRKL